MKRVLGSVVLVLSVLLLCAAPAPAASRLVRDPVGDAPAGQLDVSSVQLSNNAREVVAVVTFTKVLHGAMVLTLRTKEGRKAVLYSAFLKPGRTTKYLSLTTPDGQVTQPDCPGFSVVWRTQAKTATFRVPDSCLKRRDVSAVQFAGMSEEEDSGVVTDRAPQKAGGGLVYSAPITRG